MTPTPDTVCVVGLGYVGLPLAIAFAEAGTPVIGFDALPERVASLRAGHAGIEDITDERLAQSLASNLTVTDDIATAIDAMTYVICVPTPLRDNSPDLVYVESATHAVASVLRAGDLVVLESTTYPGTTEEIVAPILLAAGLTADDFHLAYSPERIDPGNPTYGLHNTPKVVGGTTPEATKRAAALYEPIVGAVVEVSGTREAEMAKLLENTFRHVNIALVNEMAVFCHELGIDLWEVIRAAATKPFGFMPFYPGPGVGGHCIPVDPSYLSWRLRSLGQQFRFVELAQEINQHMPAYVVTRVADLLNETGTALSRARVLCVGAAYKPGVADRRESPAIEVMQRLVDKGATVTYHDERVPTLELRQTVLTSVPLTVATLAEVDATVVLTAQTGADWVLVSQSPGVVLDTRNVVPLTDRVHRL